MPRLRKQRRRQKFQYNRNRKRVQKTQEMTKNSNVRVNSEVMKAHWDARRSLKDNLTEMGLAFDANDALKIRSTKQMFIKQAKGEKPDVDVDQDKEEKEPSEVVQRLTEEAEAAFEQARKPRFRFSDEEVRWMADMMEKHGDDFKAMAKDPKNMFQLTPKQIQRKIAKLVSIPEQMAKVAKEKGLLDT